MLEKPPVLPISAHGTMLHRRLGAAGAKLMFNTKVKRIDDGAVIVSTSGKARKHQPVRQVIIAEGVIPRQDFKGMLKRKNIRHFIIGGAKEHRCIIEATTEGAKRAWEI